MRVMDKKGLLMLDNLAILYQAAAKGMKIFPEDQFVNYAEMDFELTSREDRAISKVQKDLEEHLAGWLSGISAPEDIKKADLKIQEIMQERILEHLRSVWEYGDTAAAEELERMQIAANNEIQFFAAGVQSDRSDTWNDSLEWYEEYTRNLANSAEDDLYQKMQPIILEHLEKGTARLALVDAILDQFARVGVVRAEIIARTETTKAYNWGRRSRFDQSPALAGYRYSSIMDTKTTPICSGLHGHSWEIGHPDLDGYTPPNHFRCRSVLVPISKYVEFSFDPVDDDYLDEIPGLSDKERAKAKEMLLKFSNTDFYPNKSGS